MHRILPFATMALLAACGGQSDEEALEDAARQSDPAAAVVLNEAAEAGMDPQNALEAAGQAQLGNGLEDEAEPNSTIQARPNLPQSPNRPDGNQPPDTIDVNAQ